MTKDQKGCPWGADPETGEDPGYFEDNGAKEGAPPGGGVAAETTALVENGMAELKKKNADLIVANDVTKVGSGFGADTNQVTILAADQTPQTWPKLSKAAVAKRLVALIGQRLGGKQMAELVQVIVDVPTMQTNRPYTYRVPERLERQVQPGMRVMVPLGGEAGRSKGLWSPLTNQVNLTVT